MSIPVVLLTADDPGRAVRLILRLQRNVVLKNPVLEVKSEARNPKYETISNVQNTNFQNRMDNPAAADVRQFGNLNFEFVSDFEIRISYFTRFR